MITKPIKYIHILLISIIITIKTSSLISIPFDIVTLSKQLSENTFSQKYSLITSEGFNMDCLKIIQLQNSSKISIFHSSKGYSDNYNRLYSAIYNKLTDKWQIISKLSQRGSQGTIFELKIDKNSSQQPKIYAILVAYELQNHQHGNTLALRYYQNYQSFIQNNFLYQYQLQQKINLSKIKNIGTPSIQSIKLIKQQQLQQKFNQYQLTIKFHYSPDGSHDLPGYGYINLCPLRDFIDKNNRFIGGCKQNYTDWKGNTDNLVLNIIRKLGITGKIGQRDWFEINYGQKDIKIIRKYYLYQVNLYDDFNWKNWRILLYSQSQNKAIPIQFGFDKVVDVANPHVRVEQVKNNQIILEMTFFLPSEGMQPLSDAKPGQMSVRTKINLSGISMIQE